MRKVFFLICLLCASRPGFAQSKWFGLYTDSTSLVRDAREITSKFIADVKKIQPGLAFEVGTVLHTTPYLIYYDDRPNAKTANLPLWEQVIPDQKNFFYEVAGGELEGKRAFGLFFNGFYLPHELGHAFQDASKGNSAPSFKNEYFANVVAMLWWRKQGRLDDLKSCYAYAKTMWSKLPNPVPPGVTADEFFTKNYEKATENPYVYGYMQFKQFIDVYEDKGLPDFDTFIRKSLVKK